MHLLLFDIDQTLMYSAGAGMACLEQAVQAEIGAGHDTLAQVRPDGKTDIQILREGLPATLELERLIPAVIGRYIDILRQRLSQPDPRRHLKPGIAELLPVLRRRSDVALAVLTGNLEPTARLKLAAFDLEPYFPIGSYGSDSADRNHLGPIAVERAVRHFQQTFDAVWVIGDTPRDVECAQATPAHALGVATGSSSVAELLAAGADAALCDLSDIRTVLNTLGLS